MRSLGEKVATWGIETISFRPTLAGTFICWSANPLPKAVIDFKQLWCSASVTDKTNDGGGLKIALGASLSGRNFKKNGVGLALGSFMIFQLKSFQRPCASISKVLNSEFLCPKPNDPWDLSLHSWTLCLWSQARSSKRSSSKCFPSPPHLSKRSYDQQKIIPWCQ